MITRFTTSVVLAFDPEPDDGRRFWRMDWTETENGREQSFSFGHYTESAARRMVDNLLKDRLPGTAITDIYRDETGRSPGQ